MKVTLRFMIALFLLLPALLLAGCAGSTFSPSTQRTYSATIAEGRIAIQKALEETGGASMSVALVDGEQVVWIKN